MNLSPAATTSKKTSIVTQSLIYTSFNYLAMAVGFVVSLVSKRWLGVMGSGYWTLITVVQTWGMYVGLGIQDAMEREVPQKLGAGDPAHAKRIEDATFTYLWLASVAGGVVLWVASFWVSDRIVNPGLKILAFLIIATHLYNLALTLLRAKKQFVLAGRVILCNTVVVALCTLTGAYYFNVLGFALGAAIATAISFLIAQAWGGLRLSWRLEWREMGRLLKISSTMLASGILFKTFLDVDKLIIAKLLGPEALGLYAVGLMVLRRTASLPKFSNIVLFPYMQERYGATGEAASLTSMFLRPMQLAAYVMPVILGSLIFAFQGIVHVALPQFVGACPP